MKELRTPPLPLRLRVALRRPRLLWECALYCVGGLLLSAAELRGEVLPLGACFVAAQPFGRRSLSAAVGAMGGYLLWHGDAAGAEAAALALLLLAAVTVFHGTELPLRPWFLPLMAAAVSLILGLVSAQWNAPAALCWWGARTLLAALLTHGLRGRREPALVCACLAAGLAGLPLPWQPGLCFGLLLLGWGAEPQLLGAIGIALDLSGGTPCATALLLSAQQLCHPLPPRAPVARLTLSLALSCAVLSLFGALNLLLFLVAACALSLGTLLRRLHPLPGATVQPESGGRLAQAARVLELLRDQLPQADCAPAQSEADSIFDAAAERVCRCCPRFHRCWQQQAAVTYRALSEAAGRILERGVARAEDIDPAFTDTCCHLDGFLTAINQELEGVLYRRRYRAQLSESRQILGESYACMVDYLRAPVAVPAARRFHPLIGVSSARRRGAAVSGDRGCHFAGTQGDYFVLLCDGMGSGAEAAQICADSLHTLRELLSAGLPCSSALQLLNSSYLLRGSGCFATVDLLRLDLSSGEAGLYKWGSAPSYLRQETHIRRLGRPMPPPGVGPARRFEEFHFRLQADSLLVLVSDGAEGAAVEGELAAFAGGTPQELAALLLADSSDADDRTAVVVALHP